MTYVGRVSWVGSVLYRSCASLTAGSDLSDLDRDLSDLDRDLSDLDRDLSDLPIRRVESFSVSFF